MIIEVEINRLVKELEMIRKEQEILTQDKAA